MFEERPSPIVASAASARKLPRMALLALLIIFIIPGLLSRDFWSSYELTEFALVQSMLQSDAAGWLLPTLGGTEYVTDGPLTIWISALFAKLFGFLFSEGSASRLSVLVWFAIASSSIWYGTWYLARRAAAAFCGVRKECGTGAGGGVLPQALREQHLPDGAGDYL